MLRNTKQSAIIVSLSHTKEHISNIIITTKYCEPGGRRRHLQSQRYRFGFASPPAHRTLPYTVMATPAPMTMTVREMIAFTSLLEMNSMRRTTSADERSAGPARRPSEWTHVSSCDALQTCTQGSAA